MGIDRRPARSLLPALTTSVLFLSAAGGCRGRGESALPRPGAHPAAAPMECRYWQGPSPKLDGRLDEPGWQQAGRVRLVADRPGAPPAMVRLAWDDLRLYVAFTVPDADVVSTLSGRDRPYYREDVAELFLRPGTLPCYYEIQVSPRGDWLDQLVLAPAGSASRYRAFYPQVDLPLRVGTKIQGTLNRPGDRDRGFTVEAAIPFAALRSAPRIPPQAGERWPAHFLTGDTVEGKRVFRQSRALATTHACDSYRPLVFLPPPPLGEGRLRTGGPPASFDRRWSLADHLAAGTYHAAEERLFRSAPSAYKEKRGYAGIRRGTTPGTVSVHPGVRGRPLSMSLPLRGPQTLWLALHLPPKTAANVKRGRVDGTAVSVYLHRGETTLLLLPRTRILTAAPRWLRVRLPDGPSHLRLVLDCGPVNNWCDRTRMQLYGDGAPPRREATASR